jgi:hypothetical protein
MNAARVPAAAALFLLGTIQMAGDLLHLSALKAIGAATAASPAPKVFSAVRGLETYSTRFVLEWSDRAGASHSVAVTPDLYSGLRGPYNRRNVYGAVLAYGPVLVSDPRTQEMFDSVAAYALCGDAPLLKELGIDPSQVAGHVRIHLEPRVGTHPDPMPLLLEPRCP